MFKHSDGISSKEIMLSCALRKHVSIPRSIIMDGEEPPNCKFNSEVPQLIVCPHSPLHSSSSPISWLQNYSPFATEQTFTALYYVLHSCCTSVVSFWSQLHDTSRSSMRAFCFFHSPKPFWSRPHVKLLLCGEKHHVNWNDIIHIHSNSKPGKDRFALFVRNMLNIEHLCLKKKPLDLRNRTLVRGEITNIFMALLLCQTNYVICDVHFMWGHLLKSS